MRRGGGEGAGSKRLSTAVYPFSALSGPVPPLHPRPAAREGEWVGGSVGGGGGDSCGVGASDKEILQ